VKAIKAFTEPLKYLYKAFKRPGKKPLKASERPQGL
jgi:hypothetical protein